MRIFHWFLLVTLTMFLGGVVIAHSQNAAGAAATPSARSLRLAMSPSTKAQ